MADNSAVADAFLAAIEQGDMDALQDIYDEKVEIWHNFADGTHGRDANIATLSAFKKFRSVRYSVLERIWSGDTLAQRHRQIIETETGETFNFPVAIFIRFQDGKIHNIHEYFDSAHLQPVIAAMS